MCRYSFQAWFKLYRVCLLLLLLGTSNFVQAQNINTGSSDSFYGEAEVFEVSNAKLRKLKFGDYYVVKAKAPWITSTTHKTHRKYEENIERQKFSFTLVNGKSQSAQVKAQHAKTLLYRESGGFLTEALTGIESSSYEGIYDSSNLSASVSIINDTPQSWKLILEEIPIDSNKTYIKGSLTNGTRTIDIKQTGFGKFDIVEQKYIELSPLRYEFIEDGEFLGAFKVDYQNYATQFFFKAGLESITQLILAASMTCIKQTDYTYRFEPAPK